MKLIKELASYLVIVSMLLYSPGAYAERLDDESRNFISPNETVGGGEFYHGADHGKLLVKVLMLGSVGEQGIHYFPEDTDLLHALLYTGGISDTTKLSEITIRRKNKEDLIVVDMNELLEDGIVFPTLKDGDIVTVPWNWRKNMSTITTVTGFITAMTGFTLSLITLVNQ